MSWVIIEVQVHSLRLVVEGEVGFFNSWRCHMTWNMLLKLKERVGHYGNPGQGIKEIDDVDVVG